MQHRKQIFTRLAVTFPVCVLSLAISLETNAQESTWANSAGGNFLDAANWDSGVPSASDDANFDLDEIYDITLGADHTITSWLQTTGEVTLSGG